MITGGKTIFLVDDSPILISRLQAILEGLSNVGPVKAATSYSEALTLLSEGQPDILILDIHLGDKSGIELLRHVRKIYPAVTVIMLSNQSSSHYRLVCKILGAAHFIDKSNEFGQLPDILSPYLL